MMISTIAISLSILAVIKTEFVESKPGTGLSSLEWIRVSDGTFPNNTLFNQQTGGKVYFCRTKDSKTDKTYIGSLREGENTCHFIVIQDWVQHDQPNKKVLKSSPLYEALTSKSPIINKNLSTWTWEAHKLGSLNIPKGAIPCDTSGDETDCYLGISVYSDAICSDRAIGKVSMSQQYNNHTRKRYGLAYLVEYWKYVDFGWKAEGNTCSFFQFLTLS